MATGVAMIGVTAAGERQVLGVDAGPAEDAAFWPAILRELERRGLAGVRLGISEAHEGIDAALATVLTGASWQRCGVRFKAPDARSRDLPDAWRAAAAGRRDPHRAGRRVAVADRRYCSAESMRQLRQPITGEHPRHGGMQLFRGDRSQLRP